MQLWNMASADRMDDHRSVSIVHIQLYVSLHRKDYLTIRSCSINVYKCVSGLLLNKFSCPHINLYKNIYYRNVMWLVVLCSGYIPWLLATNVEYLKLMRFLHKSYFVPIYYICSSYMGPYNHLKNHMLQMGNVIGWLISLQRRVCSRFVAGRVESNYSGNSRW